MEVTEDEERRNLVYQKRFEVRYALLLDDLQKIALFLDDDAQDCRWKRPPRFTAFTESGLIVQRADPSDLAGASVLYGERVTRLEVRAEGERGFIELNFDKFEQGNRRFGVIYCRFEADRKLTLSFIRFFETIVEELRGRSSKILSAIEMSALSPIAVAMTILTNAGMMLLHELHLISRLQGLVVTAVAAIIGVYFSVGGLTILARPLYPMALIDLSRNEETYAKFKSRKGLVIITIGLAFLVGFITNLGYDLMKSFLKW